jgi:hypothetical protein
LGIVKIGVNALKKSTKMAMGIVVGLVWLFYAIGFMFFGVIGFVSKAVQHGYRNTLCGTMGCSDLEFTFSTLWLIGMVFVTYVVPIILIIFLIRRLRKQQ